MAPLTGTSRQPIAPGEHAALQSRTTLPLRSSSLRSPWTQPSTKRRACNHAAGVVPADGQHPGSGQQPIVVAGVAHRASAVDQLGSLILIYEFLLHGGNRPVRHVLKGLG